MRLLPQSGLFKASLADLFMNFALVAIWLFFMSPSHPPVDAVPEESVLPTEQNPGDQPAAGRQIARVTVRPDGALDIHTHGKSLSYRQYQALLQEDPAAFPDHLVFSFPDFEQMQLVADAALKNGANISIEINR